MIYRTCILITALFIGSVSPGFSQDEAYKDLLFLIIDGDYEKAYSKAERFTNKEKTKRDPVPYIYMSMAMYEMSKKDEFTEDYPRAFRDAIKYATKFSRYDRENEYVNEFDNYLSELKLEIMKEARYYFETENWRRSVTYAKYVNRIDADDLPALLLKGVAEVRSRNEYQAKNTFEEAETKLASFSPNDLTMDELPQFRYALIEYAKLMKEKGEKGKAQPYINAGEAALADDAEFTTFLANY